MLFCGDILIGYDNDNETFDFKQMISEGILVLKEEWKYHLVKEANIE
jgi:hypothetical protein